MTIAKVEQVNPSFVRITTEAEHEVVVFNNRNSELEVIIVSKEGDEVSRLHLMKPEDGERVDIYRSPDRSLVELRYVPVV